MKLKTSYEHLMNFEFRLFILYGSVVHTSIISHRIYYHVTITNMHFYYILYTWKWFNPLTISFSHHIENQSIDLQCKSIDWFLYDEGIDH